MDIPLLHRIVSLADPTLMFIGTLNHLFSPLIIMEYQARYVAQLVSGKIQLPTNFSSLLNSFITAKINASGDREKFSATSKEKTVLVGEERVDLSEFDMNANLDLSDNPKYCNKLARLTHSQGYWSQLFQQRLYWALTSLFYRLTYKISPRFSTWFASRCMKVYR